ncbi:hypothetical protein [Streptomyces sp. NPDC006739]|uniref:hypothetical protein n=1 Tax=Streptomyces sp. NPDC006739 TaxID=3364763 RepID=UPI003692B79C
MTSTPAAADRELRAWALTHARSVGCGGTEPEPVPSPGRPSHELIPGVTRLDVTEAEARDVTCMDICTVPGGPLLVATGTRSGLVRVWDGQSGRLLRTMPARGQVHSVVWNAHRDRALLAVTGESGVGIWDGLTAALLVRVADPVHLVLSGPSGMVPVRGAARFLNEMQTYTDVWGPGGRCGELPAVEAPHGDLVGPNCAVALPSGEMIAVYADHVSDELFMIFRDEVDGAATTPERAVRLSQGSVDQMAVTPLLGDTGVLAAAATEGELRLIRATSSEAVTLLDGGLRGARAMDWLALPRRSLLAIGHEDGELTVVTVERRPPGQRSADRGWQVTTHSCSHTHPGVVKATWCMTPGREPMVAVLCKDLTVCREQLPFVVDPSDLLPPAGPGMPQEPGAPESRDAAGTEPRSTSPRVDPAGLVALGRVGLWPPLSLVEDLVSLTGRAVAGPLHDPRFGALADHPGIVRLRGLSWPDRSRVGFAGLLAAGTGETDGCVPPPDSGDPDRVAALREALAFGRGPADVPHVPVHPVTDAADTVTDRMISLLTVLGPETVQADPSLPLLLARSAADMPQLDSRQLRILSTQASDGSARTRTTVHAPGTSGTANRGALTHLLPTQLALPRQVLLLKHSRHELLFRLHVTEADPLPGEVTLVLDTSPPTFGPVEGLLRAAAHVITAELWRYGRHPQLVTFDQPSQAVPIARPTDLLALWTTRTLAVPDVDRALKTASVTGVPAVLLTHHRLARELGLTAGPGLRLLTTHLADDAPAGRWSLPFQQHVPPSPHPAQLRKAISALLLG